VANILHAGKNKSSSSKQQATSSSSKQQAAATTAAAAAAAAASSSSSSKQQQQQQQAAAASKQQQQQEEQQQQQQAAAAAASKQQQQQQQQQQAAAAAAARPETWAGNGLETWAGNMGWKHQNAVTLSCGTPCNEGCFQASLVLCWKLVCGNFNKFPVSRWAGNNQREVQKRATSKVAKCQFTVGNFVKLPDAVSPTIKTA